MELKHRIRSKHVFGIVYFACLFGFLVFNILASGVMNTHADVQAIDYDTSIIVPGIGLKAGVVKLSLEDGKLNTPDYDAGSFSRADNKTLVVGHRTTVFRNLDKVNIGDDVIYDGSLYQVISRAIMEKSDISMNKILKKAERGVLVLMTCAGESLDNNDATHRLVITAVLK